MTRAKEIIDWIAEHPDSLSLDINKAFSLSSLIGLNGYLTYLTRNGTLVRTGRRGAYRFRVAEKSNGIPSAVVSSPSGGSDLDAAVAALERSVDALQDAIRLVKVLQIKAVPKHPAAPSNGHPAA